ncbi:MAG: 4-hydroxythreonine-4-phosphate dehydrogenase PdxA [Dysgonamonadaceae bacterium]|jgi:4-hydroxythreonine-4-phosphate dehydrogenase|nr:4-hydroxythreonine-4-phosphate dehydrogenase PdxA [Dysgonamonadaceae bacterium]
MNNNILITGISQGDINGISYEMIIKTFEDARMMEKNTPVLYGSSKVLAYHRKAMDLPQINFNIITDINDVGANRLNIINCVTEDIVVELSKPAPEAESMAQKAMERALDDLKNGHTDALVLAPSTVDEILLLESFSGIKPLKIFVSESLRIALSTAKIPLANVSEQLTAELVAAQLRTLHFSLVHDFMLTLTRIAVLSFNPDKGVKEQQYGKEESEVLLPAIKAVENEGIACFGPYSAEDFFSSGDFQKFDAILALHYSQGAIPFRLLSHSEGVVFFAGMPYVITAPDTSVSFPLAGRNESSETALRHALYLAEDICSTRKIDKEIRANPLCRQSVERSSDNEKLDLTKDEE